MAEDARQRRERVTQQRLPRPMKPPPDPAIQRAAVVIAFVFSAIIAGFLIFILFLVAVWLTRQVF